jgi:hypothetical protein
MVATAAPRPPKAVLRVIVFSAFILIVFAASPLFKPDVSYPMKTKA